jgi:hypothetical protein
VTNDELSDEQRLECTAVEVVTLALLRERNYRHAGAPYEVAFVRRDGESFMLRVASLQRVRALLEELAIPSEAIEVVCSIGEDRPTLLAQVRGEIPILLH